MWGNVNTSRHFLTFRLCGDNALNAGRLGRGVRMGVGGSSHIVWLLIFIFLHFFFLLITRLCSFPCQVALLVIELQPLMAVSQRGSKSSGDWPRCVPEHTTSQFLSISSRNFEASTGVHSNYILFMSGLCKCPFHHFIQQFLRANLH